MIVRQVTPLPSNGFAKTPIDLEIKEGRIARCGQKLDNPQGLKEFFFKDALISRGWVDLHVHVYFGATDISIRPEQAGLRTGETTMVDCGTNMSYLWCSSVMKASICFLRVWHLCYSSNFMKMIGAPCLQH